MVVVMFVDRCRRVGGGATERAHTNRKRTGPRTMPRAETLPTVEVVVVTVVVMEVVVVVITLGAMKGAPDASSRTFKALHAREHPE
jgi:hypothetical protein